MVLAVGKLPVSLQTSLADHSLVEIYRPWGSYAQLQA